MFPGDGEGLFEEVLEVEALTRDISRGAGPLETFLDMEVAKVEGEILDDLTGI